MFNNWILSLDYNGKTYSYNSINKSLIVFPISLEYLEKYLTSLDRTHLDYLTNNFFMNEDKNSNSVYKIAHSMRSKIINSSRFASFMIHLNYDCNLNCDYCYQGSILHKSVMSEEMERKVVDFVLNIIKTNKLLERVEICFIGGEPLLYKEKIYNIINQLKEHSIIKYSLVTNATLMDKKVIEELTKHKFDFIQITMDGDKKIHDIFRKNIYGDGSFDKIINNLIISKNYNLPVVINYNLNILNYKNVKKFLVELKKNNRSYPVIFSEVFEYAKNTISCAIDFKAKNDIWYSAHKIAYSYGYKYKPFYRRPHFVCSMGRKFNFNISPDGKLYSCVSAMDNQNYYLSDINHFDSNIFKNNYNKSILNIEYEEYCKKCKFLFVCAGPCFFKKQVNGNYCDYQNIENNDLRMIYMCK